MIKLIKSTFYREGQTRQALAQFILERDVLSMSVECRRFELRFAAEQGRQHAVFVQNGSVANFLLIQALLNLGRLRQGDKVGFSALTWPTNVMPLIQLGLVPVPVDCSLETLNVPPAELERGIRSLRALFITNVLGFCDDLEAIARLCHENDVLLLEDNCESLGSECGGVRLGNFGLSSTFSFFVGHHLSTIEGGMVCTDDSELYESLTISRAHGWHRNLSTERQRQIQAENGIDDFYAKYTFFDLASNFRPTEIQGYLGNLQLDYLCEIIDKRIENFRIFNKSVESNPAFHHFRLEHMERPSNFAMPIVCKSRASVQVYRRSFAEAGVEIRPIIAGNLTRQPFYQKYCEAAEHPNSDIVHENGFYFGNNPDLTSAEIETICALLEGQ